MSHPEIVIIAAIAEKNRVIGKDGKLPWYISEDLKRFKRLTTGHAVLMGRKTFESILQRLGKPLPERRNVVLTSSKTYPDYSNVETHTSLEDALKALAKEPVIFIIGGETLFQETLNLAHRLELTFVEGDYDGDAFFPEFEHLLGDQFRLSASKQKDNYRFETYKRVVVT